MKTKLTDEAINELAWYMIGYGVGVVDQYSNVRDHKMDITLHTWSLGYSWYDVVRARRRIKIIMGEKQ